MDKLENWRRTHYSKEITPKHDGKEVIALGWVYNIRDLGKIKFIILSDLKGEVQITIPTQVVSEDVIKKFSELKKQYVIGVKGVVKKSDKAQRGVEIIPKEIKILNYAQHPLALDPTGRIPAELDVRLDARILDLRRPESKAIFRINHAVLRAIRSFLENEGFLEVQTPKIISTATEGGASLFPVLYFDKEAFLAQSPQLYKEQLTSVFEKVYEIAPFFRAEESRTTRHTSEFISIDVEEAFVGYYDVTTLLENLVVYVLKYVKENCEDELTILNREIKVPSTPLKRLTYDNILKILSEKGFHIEWGEDIPTPTLRTLGEIFKEEFYFIIDWPTRSKPFYIKPKDDEPRLCEAFDLMYEWLELASGGTRIHEKELLCKRLKEQGLNPESFKHHLKVFDWGMPPHAGWGMGLSRLIMVITGRENIRECILFPRDRDRLEP
ncbi:MAG: aspartate--tRNA(Asn) ligase [Candidatus Bathyarchaeota archaeon]|nr:aspartate--tRNA(Asn) ligase [Candidatus Bathyarchaeota archaeon]